MKQDHSPFIPGKRVENAQHVVRIKKNVLVAEKKKKKKGPLAGHPSRRLSIKIGRSPSDISNGERTFNIRLSTNVLVHVRHPGIELDTNSRRLG